MDVNLEKLNNEYLKGRVVPFIGAGLSTPFKIPTWKELIEIIAQKHATGEKEFVIKSVDVLLERYDFWEAINQLKLFLMLSDQDIQSEVVRIINEKRVDLHDDSLHNYLDLAKMDFNLYLTTNYENLLFKYVQCDTPILMKDIDFSTQELFDTKRILHLHGITSNSGSIVLSRQSYQELYDNNKYNELLKQVTGTKTLLFMGFSFEDQFIRELIKNHRQYFKANHYIILDNPSNEKSRVLKEEYGLITIKYNSKNSSHSEEIRKILAHISEIKKDETSARVTQEIELNKKVQNVVLGAQIDDFIQDVETNLFYQKLKIEDIETDLLELSKAFYVAAEIYIRDLKLNGMSVDVINAILAKVLIKYKERYRDTYNKNGKNSNEFLDAVHETLEKFDFGRLSNLFSENEVSDEDEKRGLVHILTNEEKINIWWGENRIK